MSSGNFAVDCHLHAHWPQRFGYHHPTGSRVEVENAAASAPALFPTLQANGITHTLIIQPGAYAFDNRAMLEVIAESKGAAKGVAVMPLDAPDEEFVGLKSQGIVGVRLSLITFDARMFENEKMSGFLQRCHDHDFFVEVFAAAATWPSLIPTLVRSGARIIAEHVGWPLLEEGIHQPGFQALLEFGRNTNAIIKLSGGFRISWTGQPYDDIKPYALELLEAFGAERCIWGSDWPFLNPDYGPAKRPATVPPVNYKREYATLSNWVSDESVRRSILWTNPARLFGFSETATLNDV
jgi:predicted TIM-barrel fold metal-dependent hydrolase